MNRNIWTIIKRELSAYFTSPVAYVIIVIFLVLSGAFTFWVSRWLEARQANLGAFFMWHPWLYLSFLVQPKQIRVHIVKTSGAHQCFCCKLSETVGQLKVFIQSWMDAKTDDIELIWHKVDDESGKTESVVLANYQTLSQAGLQQNVVLLAELVEGGYPSLYQPPFGSVKLEI